MDRGLLDLDAPVSRYLPAFTGDDRSLVTVRMLLDHTSGLPAFIALWQVTAVPGDVIARICIEPLRRPPGTAPEYSDLNAILLGAVLETVGSSPLDVLVRREVIVPLGLTHTSFGVDPSVTRHCGAHDLGRKGSQPEP